METDVSFAGCALWVGSWSPERQVTTAGLNIRETGGKKDRGPVNSGAPHAKDTRS